MTPFQINFRVSLFIGLLILSTAYFIAASQLHTPAIKWFGLAMLPEAFYQGIAFPHLEAWGERIKQRGNRFSGSANIYKSLNIVDSLIRTSLRVLAFLFVLIGILKINHPL